MNNCEPLAYSIRQASEVSSIGKTRLYELIQKKQLRVTKVGRRTLVCAASLKQLIAGGG